MSNPDSENHDLESLHKHYDGYENDRKKTEDYADMVSVRALTTRIYWQCMIIFCIIGITLVVIISKDPYRYSSPAGASLLAYGGVTCYILLLGALITCSRNASTRLVLVVTVSTFLGACIGFILSMNVELQSKMAAGEVDDDATTTYTGDRGR